MTIAFKRNTVILTEAVSVEDAESLLQWLQAHPRAKADLARCTHLHAANLQVLMAARVPVCAWPQDQDLKTWLQAAITLI